MIGHIAAWAFTALFFVLVLVGEVNIKTSTGAVKYAVFLGLLINLTVVLCHTPWSLGIRP